MARRHGWQLPAHTLQVVAITVFLLLSTAFYAFFAPFLGKEIYEYVVVAVYSFLAVSVLILYVRCTAIDPADPGILISYNDPSSYKSQRDIDSLEQPRKIGLKTEERTVKHNSTCCSDSGCFFCALLVKDDCHKDKDLVVSDDEALLCTLCNAKVGKLSKHCRSCDKCVDGFDHHCRWLNNCVGRKNYATFVFLMAMSLGWLAVECGVGITVFVRCFTDKRGAEDRIVERLGGGFSRAPFATVVGICTVLSVIASYNIGELFFFHMILIRKGITTYDYIMAMRTQSEPSSLPVSLRSSPMSSAATVVSSTSLGLQYRGTWCTPPRIFIDHQDEIVPHLEPGRVPSTIDPDTIDSFEMGKRAAKRPVRISAWKLAKLDSDEAIRATAKARASSSVLRPINSHIQYDTDHHSSGNISTGSFSPSKSSYPPSREDAETYPPCSPSGFASASQLHPSNTKHFNPMYRSSMNPSPWSVKTDEGTEITGDDESKHGLSRSSVYWDQETGRFVTSQNTGGTSSRGARTELLYTGKSIFFGGPLMNESTMGGFTSVDPSNQRQQRVGFDQLPVFAPRDS